MKTTEEEVKKALIPILQKQAITEKEKMILELIIENDFYIKDELHAAPEDYDFTLQDVEDFENKTNVKFY